MANLASTIAQLQNPIIQIQNWHKNKFVLTNLQHCIGASSMFDWLKKSCHCQTPATHSAPVFCTAGDAETVELKRNAFLVLRDQSGTLLILETVRASYGWNHERATIIWKTIDGSAVDGGISRCFIKYQSTRNGWGQYTLRKQAGSSTIALATFTLEWSYSTKRSVWIYLPPATQYALKSVEPYLAHSAAEPSGSKMETL